MNGQILVDFYSQIFRYFYCRDFVYVSKYALLGFHSHSHSNAEIAQKDQPSQGNQYCPIIL
jgi:hypothetical protein